MSADAKKLRDYAKALEETKEAYKEGLKLGSPVRKPVKQLTNPSSPWKGMATAGAAILLSPEPFSDVVGIPLFLVGTGMSKYRSPAKLSDVYKHHQALNKTLKELREGLRL
ncbi:MAG: hypothetical protein FJ358_07920 [Thaumarchaeota archaeon]|nr:hypothetical protein [Nitrososphaerota archaeon]